MCLLQILTIMNIEKIKLWEKSGNHRGTIIDYLKEYGKYSFSDMPFNDVDSLLLCILSYLKFDGMVEDVRKCRHFVTLEEIDRNPDRERLFADERFEKDNRAMFEAMLAGRRYARLKLGFYINLIELNSEIQFAAVTFLLDNGIVYIAFRGTDETIVGWKEDFNMAFLSPVPAQTYSVKYLNMVTEKIRAPLYLGGHSKGGNLAVYSGINCAEDIKNRIIKIYSMDGPGFKAGVLNNNRYECICKKIVKIMPDSSLVGMLFEGEVQSRIVESSSIGLAQHNPFSWKVKGRDFVRTKEIGVGAKLLDEILNDWIMSFDEDTLHVFVDIFYKIICASQAKDLISFAADWKKSMGGIYSAIKEVDSETISMIKEMMRALLEIAGIHIKDEVGVRAEKYVHPLKHISNKKAE